MQTNIGDKNVLWDLVFNVYICKNINKKSFSFKMSGFAAGETVDSLDTIYPKDPQISTYVKN